MSSKVLKLPVEPDSVLGVQPVSDSDDDLSSPECLLSLHPVGKYYSTDNEARKEGRMLTDSTINSSECHLWEVKYFLNFSYEGYKSSKEMLGISTTDLVQECLKFCYTGGLPDFYKQMCGLKKDASWEYLSSQLYERFENRCEGSELLKEIYTLDYCNANDNDIFEQSKSFQYYSFEAEAKNDKELKKVLRIASRMNHTLKYIRNDEKTCEDRTEPTEDSNFEKSEKHDNIKGLLCHIMAFMDIDVMYNGECKLDFQSRIKDRIVKFQVTPYVTAFVRSDIPASVEPNIPASITQSSKDVPSIPFLICEAFGPSSVRALEKGRKFSTSSQTDSVKKSPDEGHSALIMPKQTSNLFSNKDQHCLSDKFMDMHTNEKVCKESLHEPDLLPSGHAEMHLNVGECKVSSTGPCPSIYDDENLRRKIRDEVTSCGPESCKTEPEADKLYGQLALQLYGAIKAKKRAMNDQDAGLPPKDYMFGLFATNQFIYLVKMSRNNSDEYTVTYSSNIRFNLYKPNDRMALLCFLFHLEAIHKRQMLNMFPSLWFQLHRKKYQCVNFSYSVHN